MPFGIFTKLPAAFPVNSKSTLPHRDCSAEIIANKLARREAHGHAARTFETKIEAVRLAFLLIT